MATQLFTNEALSDSTAVDSGRFALPTGSKAPSKIIIEIGCALSSAEDDNLVIMDLYYSPNMSYVLDTDDTIWIKAPSSMFKPVRLLVGGTYSIGEIGSGNEYHEIIPAEMNAEDCKLTVQRLNVGGGGANTITINAWVED